MSYLIYAMRQYSAYCSMLRDLNTGDVAFFPKKKKLKGYQKCRKKR